METKHTPGPWRTGTPYATGGNQCRRVPIVGGDNGPDEEVIAVVGGGLASPCDANARLISAAPELLEALEDLASLAEAAMREVGEYDIEAELADARAAIAKATGDDDAAPECTCAAKDMTFGRCCKVTPNAPHKPRSEAESA